MCVYRYQIASEISALTHSNLKPMKTDFASIVKEFERLKVVRGYYRQHEQIAELPHASPRHISPVNTSQAQGPSHLEQSLG